MRLASTTASAALAAVLVVLSGTAVAGKTLEFDVAENASRFVFDENPVFDNGAPAYGNSFVTQGYIYPHGTLEEGNGVLPDGSPQFPGKVIGTWTCRGWFVGDGARTESGPWVITQQYYDFGDKAGQESLITEGFELPEPGATVRRAVTGGTGIYRDARGEARQVLLGFNAATGVNLRFEIEVEPRRGAAADSGTR